MSSGAWMMLVAIAITLGSLVWIVFVMARSIWDERRKGAKIWRDFGLSMAFALLFFTTWIAHGIAEWQVFVDDQKTHGEPVEIGDFVAEFAKGTLENWQSEFLQLFSFVVLSALYIHKGSAESKDSDEEMQATLERIETKVDALGAKKS